MSRRSIGSMGQTGLLLVAAAVVLAATAQAGVVITPSAGLSITWDGNDGDFFNPANPAVVPTSIATGPTVTAFGSSAYPNPAHTIAHANDGIYGNSNSWLANPGDPNPYIGLALGGSRPLTGIAWSRDNGNSVTDPGPGGQLSDRALGNPYTVQYTQVASPGTGTLETGNPATGWANVGSLNYQSNDDTVIGGAFTAHYRHEYRVADTAGQPLQATGVRIKPPNSGIVLDEIELYYDDPAVPTSGLGAWLKADQGVVADGGGNVTTWADRSGSGNDATPPGASPTLVPNALAGKPLVRFAGGQYLELPTASSLGIQNSDYEIFIVAQSGSGAIQFVTAGNAGLGYYEMHLNGGVGARFIPDGSGSAALYADIGTPGQYTDGSPHLFGLRVGADTGVIKVDGLYSGDNVAGARSANNGNLRLGLRGNSTYPLTGDIAEILVYNRTLTPAERAQVEQYFNARWGTPYTPKKFALEQTGGSLVPLNVAAQSAGGVAFAKDLLGGGGYPAHQIAHLNDGLYGNSNSWIGATDPSFAGVAFANAFAIDGIAFGRDNGGESHAYLDRYLGTYTLQYTTVANPTAATPDSAWTTIEALHYDGAFPDPTGYLRHLYRFDPIFGATGVRILVDSLSGLIAIDEIEVSRTPEPATLSLLGLGALALVRRRRRSR